MWPLLTDSVSVRGTFLAAGVEGMVGDWVEGPGPKRRTTTLSVATTGGLLFIEEASASAAVAACVPEEAPEEVPEEVPEVELGLAAVGGGMPQSDGGGLPTLLLFFPPPPPPPPPPLPLLERLSPPPPMLTPLVRAGMALLLKVAVPRPLKQTGYGAAVNFMIWR